MPSITISFTATSPGNYKLGYRTYNNPATLNSYISTIIAVTTTGVQTYVIDIVDNLYCVDNDLYCDGWVVPQCINNLFVDTDLDGIPDDAVRFKIKVDQIPDPSKLATVTCIGLPIDTIEIVSANQCNDSGVYSLVFDDTYEIIPAVATITMQQPSVGTITIINPGLYTQAPTATIAGTLCNEEALPDLEVTLKAKASMVLTDISYDDVELMDGLTTTKEFILGESIVINIAEAKRLDFLGDNLAFSIVDIGNTHCQPCRNVVVNTTNSVGGVGNILYNQCWSNTSPKLVYRKIGANVVLDLECVLEESVNIEKVSLPNDPTVVVSTCS